MPNNKAYYNIKLGKEKVQKRTIELASNLIGGILIGTVLVYSYKKTMPVNQMANDNESKDHGTG